MIGVVNTFFFQKLCMNQLKVGTSIVGFYTRYYNYYNFYHKA